MPRTDYSFSVKNCYTDYMATKECNQCGITKTLDQFQVGRGNKQGVKPICKECCKKNRKKFYEDNPEKHQEEKLKQRAYRAIVKQKVFDHYGALCKCCGETNQVFLTLDHINNDGADHRRALNKANNSRQTSADKVWRNVIKEGFPPTFQILCYNCNCGKRDNGGVCPHQAKE